ncbi:hypothetical protein V5799_021766 [Amblyomma americanum]|uniref:Uncharacterized protein n=1 Tax=Amblyomma americanum TaxID=6943 RepID=A0AAQ4FMG1_AMBAM
MEENHSSREGECWYVFKGFAFGLNHRPIKLTERVDSVYVCVACEQLPASYTRLQCGHNMCDDCLGMAMDSSVLFGEDCADAYGTCPADGVKILQSGLRTVHMPFDIVTSMRAHCFNVEHGCPYQATLQDVHEHFELYCRFHPLSCRYCRRQDILTKDIVTHLRSCRGGRSSGEKA